MPVKKKLIALSGKAERVKKSDQMSNLVHCLLGGPVKSKNILKIVPFFQYFFRLTAYCILFHIFCLFVYLCIF